VISSNVLLGACHCGRLGVKFETSLSAVSFNPRACDCPFCRKHGASYISDPAGRLTISVTDRSCLREYRQGSESARFLLCGNCGVVVAVAYDDGT